MKKTDKYLNPTLYNFSYHLRSRFAKLGRFLFNQAVVNGIINCFMVGTLTSQLLHLSFKKRKNEHI